MSESIFKAIETSSIEGLSYWIDHGHVNDKNLALESPLDFAVTQNNSEFVRIILDAGGQSYCYPNILMRAVQTDDIQILELLVQYGYKFDLNNDVIIHTSDKKLRFILENFDLDIDFSQNINKSGLFYAVENSQVDKVLLLLEYGANPNLIVKPSPLHDERMSILDYARRDRPEMASIIINFLELPEIKEPDFNNA